MHTNTGAAILYLYFPLGPKQDLVIMAIIPFSTKWIKILYPTVICWITIADKEPMIKSTAITKGRIMDFGPIRGTRWMQRSWRLLLLPQETLRIKEMPILTVTAKVTETII